MRNIISTNAPVDVPAEYAGEVEDLLRRAITDRETYMREDGRKTFYVRLIAYDAPDGSGRRWAVEYFDPASWEVEEFERETDAEERYEETVRAAGANLREDDDGNQITFNVTDVPGVPGYGD